MVSGREIIRIECNNVPEIVRFSYEGKHVIIGCEDNRVLVWDWRKLKEVTLPADMQTVEIACHPNILYMCSSDLYVCKINLRTLQVSTVHQGMPELPAPVLSPDGKDVLFGEREKNGFLYWNNLTGSTVKHNAGGYT